MRHVFSSRMPSVIGAAVMLVAAAAASHAAPVYTASTDGYTLIHNFTGNQFGTIGFGDDYNTGAPGVVLTGLTFVGGLQSPNSQLLIDFYDTAGVRVATIFPSASEVSGFGVKTLSASNFIQNGVTGVPIPGAGYIMFSPYSYSTTAPGEPPVPANASPTFSLAAGGAGPTLGSNSSSLSAQTTPDPTTGLAVFSSGAFIPAGFGPTPQYYRFSFEGTLVPEPASLALISSVAAMASRRRRKPSR